MSEIFADPPDPSCYLLFSGPGIEESQLVDPDPSLYPVRDARGVRRGPATRAAGHAAFPVQAARARSCGPAAEGGGAVGSDRPEASSVAAARRSTIVAGSPFHPPGEAGGCCPGLWQPLRAAESAPGAGCSALAVGRTARFLRSFAGRVGETAARPELETNHGA